MQVSRPPISALLCDSTIAYDACRAARLIPENRTSRTSGWRAAATVYAMQSAARMKTVKKISVPDEVLTQLAELAAIPPGGTNLNTTVSNAGLVGSWGAHIAQKKFVFDVMNTLRMVHDYGNILDASTLTKHKQIAHHAHELVKLLKRSSEKKLFAIVSRDTIMAIAGLARGAERAGRLAKSKRQGKWPIIVRKRYVEGLLDAAANAGGRLTLDSAKQGGSLVDALRLLKPYLPQEGLLARLSEDKSFSTLRRIYDPWCKRNKAWLKNKKNSSRKAEN
jgi:hypothetical protein